MRFLIAFDKFKDSMPADLACQSATDGIHAALGRSAEVTQAPLSDGGEGFCPILTRAARGTIEEHTTFGPLSESIKAPIGWVEASELPPAAQKMLTFQEGRIAIIEMASAAGLEQVPTEKRHPDHCSTFGVGQLIHIAASSGANAILLGIGGSATSDLGIGALRALGLELKTESGTSLKQDTPKVWDEIAEFETGALTSIPPIFIACDVDNPLCGSRGAAAVYGPQKGLSKSEIETFDHRSQVLAHKLCTAFEKGKELLDVPGSGAAGGLGFGLNVAYNTTFLPGFELVTEWLELNAKIADADHIISGEGKIDLSSLAGKGPFSLAADAAQKSIPTTLFAGVATPDASDRIQEKCPQCEVYSITPDGCPLDQALSNGAKNLRAMVEQVFRSTKR